MDAGRAIVQFIIPPSGFLIDERVFPSLGVLKVAAACERNGVECGVWDFSGESFDASQLTRSLKRCDASTVFAFTATMPQMPACARIAREIRRQRPSARLILGGPHVTLLHASVKRHVQRAEAAFAQLASLFDVLVCGDGERAMLEALRQDAFALIDADDPTSDLWMTSAQLNDEPLAARHLIDLDSYRYEIDGVRCHSMIAQLGCPFGCNFCGGRRSPFLRRVRSRSIDCVLREITHLYERYSTHAVMFLDDELNVNPNFNDLLRALIALSKQRHVDFRFRGLVKSELVTQEQADLMYQAGFRQLLIGFESGDDRMLTNMNKHATVAQNTRCIEICKQAGLRVKALMSLGHPGESVRSVHATGDFLLTTRPDDFDVTIITVYPGTPYYDDAQPSSDGSYWYMSPNRDHLYMHDVDQFRDENFYKGMPGHYQSYVWTDYLTRQSLLRHRDELETQCRERLNIPWPSTPAARQFEHSMGAR
jgi:anaerobic magnesium-protoporphyrin IX monomethyl ester cyclase